MLSKQEVFTKVSTHLLAQGYRAENTHGDCVYLADNGAQCAVGCLIVYGAYNPIFEGVSTRDLDKVFAANTRLEGYDPNDIPRKWALKQALLASGVDVTDPSTVDMLADLQTLHDSQDPSDWPLDLPQIAKEVGLVMPLIES
jgi:hypothetical protein